MKCPHCTKNVVRIPVNWKCPFCNELLPEPGFWQRYFEGVTEYLQEKSFIFWGVFLGVVLILIAALEMLFGQGYLLRYFGKNLMFSLIMMFYGGILIEIYMKIIMPLDMIGGGGNYILKERKIIRNMRKATHFSALVGLGVCLGWAGPTVFFEYFPSYLVIISLFLALTWAIAGLFLDPKMIDDVRFRFYMDRLGVTSLKGLRKVSTITIGGIFIAVVGFIILNQVPGLWYEVKSWTIVNGAIFFIENYMAWLV